MADYHVVTGAIPVTRTMYSTINSERRFAPQDTTLRGSLAEVRILPNTRRLELLEPHGSPSGMALDSKSGVAAFDSLAACFA